MLENISGNKKLLGIFVNDSNHFMDGVSFKRKIAKMAITPAFRLPYPNCIILINFNINIYFQAVRL